MKYLARCLVMIFVAVLPMSGAVAANPDQITVLIPAFAGPDHLGQNVATVLNLRIWSTFRQKPWPENPQNLDFGRGLVIWSPEPLDRPSHREAERQAKRIDTLAQIIMWGKVFPYGNGVVVQAYLTIPKYRDFREKRLEVWTIERKGKTISVDMPRRRLEIGSIVLARDIIERYTLPSALKIYEKRKSGSPIGAVGDRFTGIQFEPQRGLAKVISNDVRGWVRLPNLSKNPTEISNFVAGAVRIFRGDWQGAVSSMDRVLQNKKTRASLRISAHLLAGMAMERMDQSGRPHFRAAFEINPLDRSTIQYLIMGEMSDLVRSELQSR